VQEYDEVLNENLMTLDKMLNERVFYEMDFFLHFAENNNYLLQKHAEKIWRKKKSLCTRETKQKNRWTFELKFLNPIF
jgi:hypothetical protein